MILLYKVSGKNVPPLIEILVGFLLKIQLKEVLFFRTPFIIFKMVFITHII